jgi:hypothetical protein
VSWLSLMCACARMCVCIYFVCVSVCALRTHRGVGARVSLSLFLCVCVCLSLTVSISLCVCVCVCVCLCVCVFVCHFLICTFLCTVNDYSDLAFSLWQAPLLQVPRSSLLPLQVGNIYQRFTTVEEGVVENIIQLGVPFLLEAGGVPGHVF